MVSSSQSVGNVMVYSIEMGDEPALIWYSNGTIRSQCWFRDGLQHRDGDEPALIWYSNGTIWFRVGLTDRIHIN